MGGDVPRGDPFPPDPRRDTGPRLQVIRGAGPYGTDNKTIDTDSTNLFQTVIMSDEKFILDVTCGGRSMWFNKKHPNAIYTDIREEVHKQYDRTL